MHSRKQYLLAAAFSLLSSNQPAQAHDIDCAIILCLAGGFPSSAVCTAAKAEMIRCVTPIPVQPPIGTCTYARDPGSSNRVSEVVSLDTSGIDYAWLEEMRILWFRARSYEPPNEPRQWDWSVRSCDRQNENCKEILKVLGSHEPWPASFVDPDGRMRPLPSRSSYTGPSNRAVMLTYRDFFWNEGRTEWQRY